MLVVSTPAGRRWSATRPPSWWARPIHGGRLGRDRDSRTSHAVRDATCVGRESLAGGADRELSTASRGFLWNPWRDSASGSHTVAPQPVRRGRRGRRPRRTVRCLRRRAAPSVTTVENLAARRGVEVVVNATEVATAVATPWAARRERSLEDMGGRGGRAVGEHAASGRRRARRSARGGRRGATPHGVDTGIRARAQRVRDDSRGGRREETPMLDRSDRRSPANARPIGHRRRSPPVKGRSHARPDSCGPGGMQGRSRLAPVRAWSLPSTPIRARGAGSADMSWSGREPAEGLLGVPWEMRRVVDIVEFVGE